MVFESQSGVKKITGIIFALLAFLFWGIAPIFADLGLEDVSPYIGLSIRTFGIAFVLLFFGLTTGEISKIQAIDLRTSFFLVGEGVLAGLLGHLAYFYGIKAGELSRIVPIAMAFPLLTAVISIVFLGESISTLKVAGIISTVVGVILLTIG